MSNPLQTDRRNLLAGELLPHDVIRYSQLAQLLASAGIPLDEQRVTQLASDAGLLAGESRSRSPAPVEEWLEQLISLGHIERGPRGVQCTAAHAFAAFRQAVLSGRLHEWRRALLTLLDVDVRNGFQPQPNFARLVALTRVILCADLHEQHRRELLRRYHPVEPARVYLAAFGSPFDAEVVDRIPADHRDAVVEGILARLLHEPQPSAREAIAWAQRRSTEENASVDLKYRTCEQLLWQGRVLEEFRPLLAGDTSARAMSVQAAAAAFAGDAAGAARLYALAESLFRGDERQRGGKSRSRNGQQNGQQKGQHNGKPCGDGGGTGKKNAILKLPLASPMAFAHVAVLLAAKTPVMLREAQRRCMDEARNKPLTAAAEPWEALAQALEVLSGHKPAQLILSIGPEDAFVSLMSLAAVSWAQLRLLDDSLKRTLENWAQTYAAAGYERAALELRAGLAIARNLVLEARQKETFIGLFAHEQPWQRALSALAAVVTPPAPLASGADTKQKRNVWVIQTDAPGGAPVISVREQTQTAGGRGWTRGRSLYSSELERADLPEQDARVLSALRPELRRQFILANGYSSADTYSILPALIGHPLVVFSDDPTTAVDLTKATPELIVEQRPEGGISLRLPSVSERQNLSAGSRQEYEIRTPYGASVERCVLVRQSATRASVMQITNAHRRVIDLIGAGLDIPEEGIGAAVDVLASVAGLFEVHSQIATAVSESAGDATIHAVLLSVGGGLRLRLAVQPFGIHGPRYPPGVGGVRVITAVSGECRAALRDLDAERRAMARVLETLPALGEDGGDCEWVVQDPEQCLELVSALQSLGEGVCVEWPAGKKVQVTRRYRARDLGLHIDAGDGQDWFAVSGRLVLDDGTVLLMQRLMELTRVNGGRYLPLGDAGFLALTDGLRRRLDELASAGTEQADGSLRISALAAGSLTETFEDTAFEGSPEWHARLARLQQAQTLEVAPPSTLQTELRPYQLDGFQWLARLAHWGAGACLADDMGLGKTVQAIAMLLHRAAGGAALVVAPTSVCPNWIDELARFAPTLNVRLFGGTEREDLVASVAAFDVVVCSYALVQQELNVIAACRWHTLVLDEAQAVKNPATKRAQAVLKLSADFRLATTGTPVENRLDELWMLFRFLNPGLLGSRETFNERFAGPIERRQDAPALARLKRLIAPFVLRRTKSEVLSELPPRTEMVHLIEPSEQERAFHEALRRSAVDAITAGTLPPDQRRFRVLVELTRIRRACCDPRLVAGDTGIDGVAGAKLEAFAELALELVAGRHKALVFSQFVDYLGLLRAKLETLALSYQYLDGSTPAADRARRVRAFQSGEGDFFLISLKAGAFGLNLTAADYVIIADPWWNPAVEDQAAGRAHRMGQRRPVTVYRLVIKDSVEERIMSLHRDKRALAEGLFAGEEFGKALSVEELTALLRGSSA
jgi:superfamily II DNA or RNA helicase